LSCRGEKKKKKRNKEGLGQLRKQPKRLGGKTKSFSISKAFINSKLF
jgi:hypothetical protein